MNRAVLPTRLILDRPWGRLCVWRAGVGPKLVLALHGLGGSGRYWLGLRAALGEDWTIIAPDHGGFGRSDKPALRYDRSFHLDNLDAVVAEMCGQTPIAVVGHSLGGVLAALWSARHPNRIRALALVAAPSPRPDDVPSVQDPRTEAHDRRGAHHFTYSALQRVWPFVTFPLRSRTFPRAVIADFMRHTPPSYWGTMSALLWDPQLEHSLQGLTRLNDTPSLILTGSQDRRIRTDSGERWGVLLPRADRVNVTEGHQLLLSTRFVPLAAWLQRHAPNDDATATRFP